MLENAFWVHYEERFKREDAGSRETCPIQGPTPMGNAERENPAWGLLPCLHSPEEKLEAQGFCLHAPARLLPCAALMWLLPRHRTPESLLSSQRPPGEPLRIDPPNLLKGLSRGCPESCLCLLHPRLVLREFVWLSSASQALRPCSANI